MFHIPEHSSAVGTLAWALGTFEDRIALSTAFGPGGIVLMHLAARLKPGVKVLFIDTGFHFDETLAMVTRVQSRLDVDIQTIKPKLGVHEQNKRYGNELPVLNPTKCCQMRKVDPTGEMLNGLDAWVTALRRDQSSQRAGTCAIENKVINGRDIVKINPLVGWTRKEVWRHIFEHALPYNTLHDNGYLSVGCRPCTTVSTDPNDERSGRWTGHKKTECGLHTAF
ncbi:MAG: phosphoadenylyl-sulfate reductase [Myxococcales bacterium]|nr:phosphoadenylyl-sulfate reductase [Myxococcales bacterium]